MSAASKAPGLCRKWYGMHRVRQLRHGRGLWRCAVEGGGHGGPMPVAEAHDAVASGGAAEPGRGDVP